MLRVRFQEQTRDDLIQIATRSDRQDRGGIADTNDRYLNASGLGWESCAYRLLAVRECTLVQVEHYPEPVAPMVEGLEHRRRHRVQGLPIAARSLQRDHPAIGSTQHRPCAPERKVWILLLPAIQDPGEDFDQKRQVR